MMSDKVIKVLLIEDNPGDVRFIQEMLSEVQSVNYDLYCEGQLQTGLKHLSEDGIDVVLLDLGLPDSQGLDTFSKLYIQAKNVPIVILTGFGDETAALNAVQMGAQDYLVKGSVDGHTLSRIIRYAIERKRVETKLRQSEEHYRLLVKTMNEGFIELDKNYRFSYVNEAICRLLAYSRDEMIGQPASKFFDEINGGILKGKLAECRKGKCESFDIAWTRKDRDKVFTIVSQRPVFDGGDKFRGCFAVITNVTRLKKVTQELQEYSGMLEERVEQRTKELQQAQKEMVCTEKLVMLGRLAGGVAHELRNPLGAIKNAVFFLNMALEKSDQEIMETLELLEKEANTSERIISSLFNFASTKQPVRQRININEVIQDALLRNAIPNNVGVVKLLNEELPNIQADPDQLAQVFENIILNTFQAMSERGQLIIKSYAPRPEWMAVSFTDTGMGIPKAKMEKIFEPLFTTKAKGIGLGLAVSKTLVEGHWFKSQNSLKDKEKGPCCLESSKETRRGLLRGMIEKPRILIVDDNESLSKSMLFVLKRRGFTAATARDGLEALNVLKKKSFDIIFLDIKMSGLNGVETFKKIKKISSTCKVVMMTAYALDELVQDALEEGAYGILYKPLDMEEAIQMIEEVRGVDKSE